jgi:prepilin-type N-terminal cleavage/methylation domain-containing protein
MDGTRSARNHELVSTPRMTAEHGFTLVELMLVVSVVLILGVVAYPAFQVWIKKSRASEARELVQTMYENAHRYYVANGRFPASSTAMTPAPEACCEQGGKCAPSSAYWRTEPDGEVWAALDFSVDDSHYYSYQYEAVNPVKEGPGDKAMFIVRARGDLDCDGTYATFELHGVVDDDGPSDATLIRIDELE